MSGKRIAILVVLLLVLCCVFTALGILAYRFLVPTAEAAARPVVTIDSPRHGEEVTVGEIVQIFGTARDETGIDYTELWVDGAPIETQRSASAEGTNPFPVMGEWMPETAGTHTIVVRAYNMAGDSAQASISVNALQAPDLPTEMPEVGCEGVPVLPHQVQEGETVEGIAAGHEVTVEELLACNPGVADPLTPGHVLFIPYIVSPEEEEEGETPADVPDPEAEEEPGGEEAPPPEESPTPGPEEATPDPGPPPPTLSPLVMPPTPTPPPPPVVLEFEALELQVNEDFMVVYCNVELEGHMERVPLDPHDFLAPTGLPGEYYWDIGAELAGVHSVPLAVPQTETVDLMVNCLGFFPMDLIPYDLGSFTRNHGEGDWHGERIEATSTGGDALPEGGDGQFTLGYRICQGDCEDLPVPEPPTNLQMHWHWMLGYWFTWDWAGTYPIEGFRLYRDGALLQELDDPTATFMFVETEDVLPPCTEDYEFTLTAYEGAWGVGAESAHSTPPFQTWGAVFCTKTARVRFDHLSTLCLTQDCPDPEPGPLPPACSNCEVEVWYGSMYANSQRIEKAAPVCDPILGCDFALPVETIHSIACPFCIVPEHPIAGPGGLFNDDTVDVPLGPFDSLTMGISLTDWDQHSADDFICEGATTVGHSDIIAGHWGMTSCQGGDPPQMRARLYWEIVNVF